MMPWEALDDDADRPLSSLQRFALVLALAAGVLTGVSVTGFVLDDGGPRAMSPHVRASIDPLMPIAVIAHEGAPTMNAASAAKPARPHPARTPPRPSPRRM